MAETAVPRAARPAGPGEPELGLQTSAKVSARARVRYNALLKLLRRAHLFAGLFMTPWVFLYGVTGFLFNHPDAFPDRQVRHAGRSDLKGTDLEGFPTAPELAGRVVAALNGRTEGPGFRVVDRGSATFSRSLFVTATGGGREHSVRFDPDSGESFIRSTEALDNRSPALAGTETVLRLADPPRDRLAKGVPALLAKLGVKADATTVRNPPDLVCTAEGGGRLWRVSYNLQSGATSVRPADDPSRRLSGRRFLTGMHLAFTYPSRLDVRWFWAVAVDAMFASMVFWGVSGLLMWWQLKKMRWWGAATLVASAAVAAALAVGMHDVLASRV